MKTITYPALARHFTLLLVMLLGCGHALFAWTPGTASPGAVQGLVVDPTDRRDVLSFYHCIYTASENYAGDIAWSGNVGSCIPGTTSAIFKDDVRRRINFYRALAALPADIAFDTAKSSKDQDAVLMFSSNNALSHTPPTSWTCYSATGAEAAGSSNIALGTYGPRSIDAFIRDDGAGNMILGHRRWLTYSRAQNMGTGDIPNDGTHPSANAIWVIGNFKAAPAPQFVTWPNRGFVPFPLTPARWSLSYPGADFSAATVTMTQGVSNVPVTIVSNVDNGYGDNTLGWEPAGLPGSIGADTTYNITVSGIAGAGVPSSYSYSVTLFDPLVLGESITISGSNAPPASGASYTFNTIAQADSYELRVSTGSVAAWAEGAEDSPPPQIQPATTGSYPLRQTAVKRTGSKAFQLAFPDFNDQSFIVTRDLLPSAASQLQFYDLGRFAATSTTLDAEVSADNGGTWTSVWSRNGVGLNSALWDPAFISRGVSLASYAGQVIRIRFILRTRAASITIGTSSSFGFFIDDITVTNATELAATTTTTLAGSATSFTLDAATAGAPLVAGTSYFLRMRPNVGCRWWSDGALKTVTAQAPTGYAAWVATQYPAVTEGPNGDHDRDGLSNGIEYAFGFNPTVFTSATALPQPARTGSMFTASFTQPAGVTGVTYGAQWTTNLLGWNPITDTGTGGTHTFSVSLAGQPRMFFRYNILIAP